jgi:hypothetical protein
MQMSTKLSPGEINNILDDLDTYEDATEGLLDEVHQTLDEMYQYYEEDMDDVSE